MQCFPVVFLVSFWLWTRPSGGYYELVEELGCHDTEFRLTCGPLDAQIAILEATFSQNDSFLEPVHTSCGRPGHPTNNKLWLVYDVKDTGHPSNLRNITNGAQEINFRHAINRRCSGLNFCSFMLYGDYSPAINWGPGAVYLRYACMDGVHVTKSCNANVSVELEGFVQTPGYPRFYVGGRTCHWTLKAPPLQQVKVTFLDISLRGLAPMERNCMDWLIVSEDGLDILSTCGDVLGNQVVKSAGQELNVTFTTASKRLFPKRGLYFHYKAVGCPTPSKPVDGYLVHRNDTYASYRCCVGYAFPDTMIRDRTLQCFNENTWDNTLPDCINVSAALSAEDIEDSVSSVGNLTFIVGSQAVEMMADNINDVIIPSIIICLLFLGNGLIIGYILLLRRRQAAKPDELLLQLEQREVSGLSTEHS